MTDVNNCGACGHSCVGGACTAGVCQPVEIAAGEQCLTDLAVNAAGVFWTDMCENGGSVRAVARAGGAPADLATGLGTVQALAVDQANAYVLAYPPGGSTMDSGTIYSVPVAGGNPTKLFSGAYNADTIAIDDQYVYWSDYGNGGVQRIPKTGAANDSLVASSNGRSKGIAVDATSVYWLQATSAGPAGLWRTMLADGSQSQLVGGLDGSGSIGLAVDAQDVFFSNGSYNDGSGNAVSYPVMKVAIGGGTPQVLDSNCAADGLALDANSVYFACDHDAIRVMPKAGGTPTVLVPGIQLVWKLVVDYEAVYWLDQSQISSQGNVWKVAK